VFTDKSTGSSTSWYWDFGDRTYSFVQNPKHNYSAAGNYTVSFTATNAIGNNTVTKSAYIKVARAMQKPVASFISNVTSRNALLSVSFADKSTGSPTSWYWDFGDRTYSTIQNPVHVYNKAGQYTVILKVTSTAGSNTVKKIVRISQN
jgi:PKD repeat protein